EAIEGHGNALGIQAAPDGERVVQGRAGHEALGETPCQRGGFHPASQPTLSRKEKDQAAHESSLSPRILGHTCVTLRSGSPRRNRIQTWGIALPELPVEGPRSFPAARLAGCVHAKFELRPQALPGLRKAVLRPRTQDQSERRCGGIVERSVQISEKLDFVEPGASQQGV